MSVAAAPVTIEVRDEFIRFINEYFNMLLFEISPLHEMTNPISQHFYTASAKDAIREIFIPMVDHESLGALLDTFINTMVNEFIQGMDLDTQWLNRIDAMLATLERIHSLCRRFLESKPDGLRIARYNALKKDVKDLLDYAGQMYAGYAVCRAKYNDHYGILLTLARTLNPYLFWKCFWWEGTEFITDNSENELEGIKANNRKIKFLKFIEVPIQALLTHFPEQYAYCRDSLQDLLDNKRGWRKSIDKMQRLYDNDSFAYALQITGIEIVPRPSLLTEGTLLNMHSIPYQRRPNAVYMPLPPQ